MDVSQSLGSHFSFLIRPNRNNFASPPSPHRDSQINAFLRIRAHP